MVSSAIINKASWPLHSWKGSILCHYRELHLSHQVKLGMWATCPIHFVLGLNPCVPPTHKPLNPGPSV